MNVAATVSQAWYFYDEAVLTHGESFLNLPKEVKMEKLNEGENPNRSHGDPESVD
ncbi:MAG: hypothetical protein GY866_23960 [Proteobacteria bacterium]|nr:hypothetical protein [Pseudomonadota bacterium]